jgi:hypothetical protein
LHTPHQGSYVNTPYGKTFLTIDLNLVECALMSGPSTWRFNAAGPDAVRELAPNQSDAPLCADPWRVLPVPGSTGSHHVILSLANSGVLVRQAEVIMRLEPPGSDILAARP